MRLDPLPSSQSEKGTHSMLQVLQCERLIGFGTVQNSVMAKEAHPYSEAQIYTPLKKGASQF